MDYKNYFNNKKDEMIETLGELVAIPSYMSEAKEGMPFGEGPYKALHKMLDKAENDGFYVRNIDNYVGTIDMYADKEPSLGILCHLDVVPEGKGWTSDPYTLTKVNGKLVGRGTIDDKGPAVAVLYALKAIKESGIKLSENVRFIVGTNEENGSGDIEHYTKKEKMPPVLFTPDGDYPVINIEKGMLRVSVSSPFISSYDCKKSIVSINAGKTINAVPEEAFVEIKGIDTDTLDKIISLNKRKITLSYEQNGDIVTVKAKGKGAHASTPEKGDNALTGLLSFLSEDLFKEFCNYEVINKLHTVFPYNETDGLSTGVKCYDDISGALTLVFSVLETKENKICGKIDIRFPINETKKDITDKLTDKLSEYDISIDSTEGSEPHHVEAESEFVKTLLRVYEECTGEKGYCKAIGGGTYVHETEGGVAFGAVFPGEDNNMHGADEYISEDNFLLNAEIFAKAIIELCK